MAAQDAAEIAVSSTAMTEWVYACRRETAYDMASAGGISSNAGSFGST